MSILDDLPELFNNVLGDLVFYEAVLSRDAPGAGGSTYNPGEPSRSHWPCRAIDVEWKTNTIVGGLVSSADRQILILAASLPGQQPREGDNVLIVYPNQPNKTFRLTSEGGSGPAVSSDPANATWSCRGRG